MDKVHFPYRSDSHLPFLHVIQESGSWEKHGLQVEYDYFISSEDAHKNVANGSVEFVGGNHVSTYGRRATGDRWVYIAQSVSLLNHRMVVRADSGISKVSDLKGKVIGSQGEHPGLNTWLYLRQNGLEGSVEVVRIRGEGLELWETVRDKKVDAAFINPPADIFARRADLKVIEVEWLPMVWFTTVSSGLPFVEKHSEIVDRFLRGFCEGIAYFKTHRAESIKVIKEKYKVEGDLDDECATHLYEEIAKILQAKPYASVEAIGNVYELAKKQDPAAEKVEPMSLWDFHYLRRIDDSGFIDNLYRLWGKAFSRKADKEGSMPFKLTLAWILVLTVLGVYGGRLFAASAENFYEGKTIRMIVSSPPGGGTDTAARLVSRFIGKYIPGNPKIIVQNMPGGASTIANNYFTSEVKPDGLTIMQDSSAGVANFVRGGPTIKYDPRKYRVIGGVSRPGSLLMIRNEARPRLMDRGAKPVVVGDTDGIRSWLSVTVWGAEYLGWNLRWIYGYPGSRELQLAIRQGEIDMWATQNLKLVKDLQREGVVQLLLTDEETRREDFPDVPTFNEVLGPKKPTGVAWQAYLGWAGASELDKVLVAPEGTPDHLVKILRAAFNKVMKDPEVDKEGDKFFGDGWKPHTAEKMEAVIRDHIAIPKEAKDFMTKMRQKYGLPTGEKKS